MRDYRTACADFSVDALVAEVLSGSLDRSINACFECCDRWADSDRVALIWLNEAQDRQERVTYRWLRDQSARFANVLQRRGIQPGDVVAGMLPHSVPARRHPWNIADRRGVSAAFHGVWPRRDRKPDSSERRKRG
jgi:acetyl-CoA synthetase